MSNTQENTGVWIEANKTLPRKNEIVIGLKEYGAIFLGRFDGVTWWEMDGFQTSKGGYSSFVAINPELEVTHWINSPQKMGE